MNRRLPRSAADDERGEGGCWPDTSDGLLGRPTDGSPAPQPATSVASSRPAGDTPHNGRPTGRRVHWRLPATESSTPVLRRALGAFLHQSHLSDDQRYDLLLAAGEAACNAIEHAVNPTEPFFEVLAEIGASRVTIVVSDHGQWRDGPPGTHRGRGLQMMWILADTTITAGRHGTTVTIRSSPRHGRHASGPHDEPVAANIGRTSSPRAR